MLSCQMGLSAQAERSVSDTSGTVTVTLMYSVLESSPLWDALEVTARCSMVATAGEPFGLVSVDAVGETPDDT